MQCNAIQAECWSWRARCAGVAHTGQSYRRQSHAQIARPPACDCGNKIRTWCSFSRSTPGRPGCGLSVDCGACMSETRTHARTHIANAESAAGAEPPKISAAQRRQWKRARALRPIGRTAGRTGGAGECGCRAARARRMHEDVVRNSPVIFAAFGLGHRIANLRIRISIRDVTIPIFLEPIPEQFHRPKEPLVEPIPTWKRLQY